MKVKRHIRLKIFLRSLVVNDLFFLSKSLILASLSMRYEFLEDEFLVSLFGIVRSQGCLRTTLLQAGDLGLVSEDAITEWFREILTDFSLHIRHGIDSFEEALLGQIAFIVLLELDLAPECFERHDELFECLLVFLLPDELLSVEVVIGHIEIIRHQLAEHQKQLSLLRSDLVALV